MMFTKEDQLKKKKKPRKKKCKNCGVYFTPERDMQTTCSFKCALEYAQRDDVKKKAINKKKREFNSNDKKILRVKIQKIANQYGKMIDYSRWKNEGCITCGIRTGKVDGGHFLPTSTYPSIRYYAKQIKGQCVNCNRYNGGKPVEYEEKMRKLYGDELVDRLKKEHRQPANYSVEYMKKYIRVITKRVKILKARNGLIN